MQIPLSVMDFLDRAELVYGDRVGIVDEPVQPAESWGELSYRRVAELARAQATGLDRLGVGPGERVAIVSHNSARLLTSFFGVSGYGRVLVPVNFRLRAEEVAYIVEQSGASVLLVDPELADALDGVVAEHKFVIGADSDALLYDFDNAPRRYAISENDTATINYTSGTTARPKGVQITHRNAWLNATLMGLHYGASDRDVYLHTLPMFHANGWGLPFAITGLGARHIVLRKVDGAEILRRVERHGVTFLSGAPAVVQMVLDAAADWDGPVPGRDRVRMIVAGAPPPTSVVQQVEEQLGWEFMQLYGLTETAPIVTVNRSRAEWDALPAAERAEKLVQAGAPALGTQLRVDASGEVLVRSNTVLDGYWRQPEATAEALRDDWFHTGDGGTLTDGQLTISDRKKDVIISGGENVSSIEVEDCLYGHPAVAEAAVIGVPHEKWGETVKALVVLRDGQGTVTEAELIAHCKQRLAGYKSPTSVEFRDALPRTATGKLQKFRLREPYWSGRERQVN
ncbi:AMP-binding protein [Kitasatospora aureofaciens]|uniref:AMP-dependent synthetase n=1 Tax=Kitasatospora aureofaciens TaxID=1894 RepID=A0A1E7N564_KITAU|nr:AMP-binding protein [Kitasatospora aureofaciens]ARF80994.1 AMP-dependent synthetase [Kitasatospora aureofaciens]OEV35784.1 AMP-dependent synthetase [Kitasatospora aureofaciens]GGU63739.1 AMP-dependent synthetase [Kitasatospora aureofaciens]